jgi:hypothetical protein
MRRPLFLPALHLHAGDEQPDPENGPTTVSCCRLFGFQVSSPRRGQEKQAGMVREIGGAFACTGKSGGDGRWSSNEDGTAEPDPFHPPD